MKKALVQALCSLMIENDNIFLFVGDLGFGVMDPIIEKHKDRFINAGICEQNMISAATGLALSGSIVFVYSIGNFPTLRCIEQIRNDAAYHNANVKIVAVGGGFAYGQLGMSHHATEDIAMFRTLPNITVLAPADPNETIEAVKFAAKTDGPVYIRLGRGGEQNISHKQIDITKPIKLQIFMHSANIRIALIGSGTVMVEVENAATVLGEKYEISAYSLAMVKPVDEESIKTICAANDYVFTIEEHQVTGGIGSLVAEIIAENSIPCCFKRIGINNQFTQIVGSPLYLRKVYSLDMEGIISIVEKWVEKK